MDALKVPYLDIRLSTRPGSWKTVALDQPVTYLGRPEVGEAGVDLEYRWVARKQARIFRQEAAGALTYVLENWRDEEGIRLYERLLERGETHVLHHGYTFRVPGILATLESPHFHLTFCANAMKTISLSIKTDGPPVVSIFGKTVDFTPQEYRLVQYLHARPEQLCPYHDIIAQIWAGRPHSPAVIQAYLNQLYANADLFSEKREALDILLAKVRGKISKASGGVTLIETVWGEGIRLRS